MLLSHSGPLYSSPISLFLSNLCVWLVLLYAKVGCCRRCEACSSRVFANLSWRMLLGHVVSSLMMLNRTPFIAVAAWGLISMTLLRQLVAFTYRTAAELEGLAF